VKTTATIVLWPFVRDYPGEPVPEETLTHPPSWSLPIFISFFVYYDPQHPPCSNCVLRNLFAQPLSMSFLVYLLVWRPPPHIPYISSLNQYLLFTTHAYTTNSVKALKASVSHNTQNN